MTSHSSPSLLCLVFLREELQGLRFGGTLLQTRDLLLYRQGNDEGRSLSRGAPGRDRAGVPLDNSAADRKPDPRSLILRFSVETLEGVKIFPRYCSSNPMPLSEIEISHISSPLPGSRTLRLRKRISGRTRAGGTSGH